MDALSQIKQILMNEVAPPAPTHSKNIDTNARIAFNDKLAAGKSKPMIAPMEAPPFGEYNVDGNDVNPDNASIGNTDMVNVNNRLAAQTAPKGMMDPMNSGEIVQPKKFADGPGWKSVEATKNIGKTSVFPGKGNSSVKNEDTIEDSTPENEIEEKKKMPPWLKGKEPKEGDSADNDKEDKVGKKENKRLKDEDEGDEDEKKSDSKNKKSSKKDKDKDDVKEEVVTTEEVLDSNEPTSDKIDVSEHVEAIFNGETLSEEFKEKVKTIFEGVVNSIVEEKENALREVFHEEYQKVVVEAFNQNRNELAEQLDAYLSYVVENWMSENEVAIENGIRTEIAENFMSGLKNLFLQNNIEVPQSKVNVLDELATKVDTLETKLNEQINHNVALKKSIEEYKRKEVISEASKGLSSVQADKLNKLIEGVTFDSSSEDYAKKVSLIKENYFGKGSNTTKKTLSESNSNGKINEIVIEDDFENVDQNAENPVVLDESIQRMSDTLSKLLASGK